MELKLSINFSDEDKQNLQNSLGCSDEKELRKKLGGIAKAAFEEYIEMILGKHLPTKSNEFYERRLFHLIKFYFDGRIPSEKEVVALMAKTKTGCKTLIENVCVRYKHELNQEILNTIHTTLKEARFKADVRAYYIPINSGFILEELKQTVSDNAPQLDQISKKRGAAGTYCVSMDTYVFLCEYYGIEKIKAAI